MTNVSRLMPCANTEALRRFHDYQDKLEAGLEMIERRAEDAALYDQELLNEMVIDQSGESSEDEELMLLIIAAGVDAFCRSNAPNADKIEKLIQSRDWFATAVEQAKRDLS